MKKEWSVRAYKDGDEEGIYNLWQDVYPSDIGKGMWMKRWRWMYRDIPYGSHIWLADDKGKIVGQYCVRITKTKIGNNMINAAHSLDTATHPDYRRQGIMLALSRKTFDELSKNGVHVIWGYPNKLAYANDIRLGFHDVAAMKPMIKVLRWDSLLKTRIRNRLLLKCCFIGGNVFNKLLFFTRNSASISGLNISRVPRFDSRINEFWAKVSSKFPIIVVRSDIYLNWRYTNVPNISYSIYLAENSEEISGYLVLRYRMVNKKKAAVICDLLAESGEVAQCLLHKITEDCRNDRIDYIQWGGIASKAYLRTFQRSGFFSPPFQKSPSRFVIVSSASDISPEFLFNPQNWLIQKGDTDTV
jgi:GNAT superfamily N-acetyltransferase